MLTKCGRVLCMVLREQHVREVYVQLIAVLPIGGSLMLLKVTVNIQPLIKYSLFQGNVSTLSSTLRISKSQIPNATGTFAPMAVGTASITGCFSVSSRTVYATSQSTYNASNGLVTMDLSKSSDCYGAYTEVNPLYQSCIFCIKF